MFKRHLKDASHKDIPDSLLDMRAIWGSFNFVTLIIMYHQIHQTVSSWERFE